MIKVLAFLNTEEKLAIGKQWGKMDKQPLT